MSKMDSLPNPPATLLLFSLRNRNACRAITRLLGNSNQEAASKMSTLIRSFLRDQTGATAIEYGLIAAGIAVAIITVVASLGTSLNMTSQASRPRSSNWPCAPRIVSVGCDRTHRMKAMMRARRFPSA